MAHDWRLCFAWAQLRYVTVLQLTLAVIEDSGDASAAEACTTLSISREDPSTWVERLYEVKRAYYSLAGQLLWSVVIIRRVSTKAPERDPRAPSWSWASVHKPVYEGRWSMNPNVNTLIKIVSIDLELENQDPFGQVRAGRLQIEGPLIKTTLRRCTRNDQDEYRWKHWLGDGLASIKADVEDLEEWREVRCLPIQWVSGEYPAVYGLLVEPTHKKKGEHRRVGWFVVTPFYVEAQTVDKFLAWRQFQLLASEWEECLGQNSEDKAYEYRFSLV